MSETILKMLVKLSLLVICIVAKLNAKLHIDPKGYILYCPCMGRFGNQADHFLGALSFARALDRTLVLPPWVEYHPAQRNSVQVPFTTYFSIEAVIEYHRAITMEDFMKKLAPKIWPVGNRTAFCYMARNSLSGKNTGTDSCHAKDGNPFGPFWDTFNVDFDDSEFYGPLAYNTDREDVLSGWMKKYPPETHPVLAFTGAPANFPVREVDLPLQKYVQWSPEYEDRAFEYIKNNLERPYIGIHLRNGIDFDRACEHVSEDRNLFASAQCLGFHNEHGPVTKQLCMPSEDSVVNQLKKAVKKYKAKSVFIATDNNPMISQFEKAMKKVKFVTTKKESNLVKSDPHLDLAILGQADHYICNCVSTFSGFVTRERRVNNKSVEFWNFTPKKQHEIVDEL